MSRVTARTLQQMKSEGRKFAALTAYDSTFARLIDEAGIEMILIGDSLGMVLQGHDSTLPVTIDNMVYHTACVARATTRALVVADLPFMSYSTTEQTLANSAALMRAGAHMVKLEGGAWLAEPIAQLTRSGVPVCAHLGLTPQSVNVFGGFRIQGRDAEQARRILDDARTLIAAGAVLLVLECVPRDLAARITASVHIPVIGIGAGVETDGQVLVMHDMLGLNPHPPRFVRDFLADSDDIPGAFRAYADAVRHGSFPASEHGFD